MRNYFKKFSFVFMITLTIIGIGMIYGGSGANAATVGQQLASPETGWQRFDDSNNKIRYIGSWKYWPAGDSHSSGDYDKTAHTNSLINDNIKFKFKGSKIRIIAENRADSYYANNEVYIDGVSVGNFRSDDYSKVTNNYTGMILQFEKSGLDFTEHDVEIICERSSYWYFDAIDIDNNGMLITYDESITLDKSTINLTQGDSQQLTATTTPAGAQVNWKSSGTSIASVDSTGKVTGVKEGTCTITATTVDGLTATCVVTVTPKGTDPNPQPADTDKIVNIAHAKGTNTNNPGGEVTIIFHGSADTILSVIKTADVKEVWIGDNFTYTLVITNTGTKTAKAVVVNDPAPNHIDFNVSGVTTTQGSVDSSSTSKNIIVNVGDILPGGTVTIKIPSTVIA